MTCASEIFFGSGVVTKIPELLAEWRARRCVLVASSGALRRTSIIRLLDNVDVAPFQDFTPNPQLSDVLAGVDLVDSDRPDAIIAVGGGSALDVAKLMRVLPADWSAAGRALGGESRLLRATPARMLAVPTTAGTGSEVTAFATVYIGKRKHSLDDPRVRPDVAVIDPLNAAACPPSLTATCALDALAHAIESLWSVRSSVHSRLLARSALVSLARIMGGGLASPTPEQRAELAEAAVYAGLAIDLTRTTAAHACAYPTTAYFGVPHGLACALHLMWLLPLTAETAGQECRDARGPSFLRRRLDEISGLLGTDTPHSSVDVVASLVRRFGLSDRLSGHGLTARDLPTVVDEALVSVRAANHPTRLDPTVALRWMRDRL